MKLRLGFVTNSSSTSFILAIPDVHDIDEEMFEKYPKLRKVLDFYRSFFYDGDPITDVTSLREYFCDHYGFDNDDTFLEQLQEEEVDHDYNRALEYINQGYTIVTLVIEYGEERTYDAIRLASENGDVIIIGGDY